MGAQGCASRAQTPKGPQITLFCHQLGRHPTVLDATSAGFRQISARRSLGGSRPLNLNFFFTILGPKNVQKKVEFEGVGPIWRDPRRNLASTGISSLQNGWMAT